MDETADSFLDNFEPECILPSQYRDNHGQQRGNHTYRDLYAAFLMNTIREYIRPPVRDRVAHRRELRHWFLSENIGAFTLEGTAEMIGVGAELLRAGIMKHVVDPIDRGEPPTAMFPRRSPVVTNHKVVNTEDTRER